jgi:cholesterol oxidase
MGLAATLMTARQEGVPRVLTWLANLIRNPLRFLKATLPFGFGKEALILLVMQSTNNYMRVRMKRSWLSPFRRKLETEMVKGSKVPTYIPQANEFVNRVAKRIDAIPMTGLTEILFDVPTSAHLLGGAPMGASAAEGVIDHRNRVFNYKNMYVCDGSMIGANLGVNPSLSITALSEHAMSYIQPAEQTDWNDTAEEVASSPQVAPAAERARQQPA